MESFLNAAKLTLTADKLPLDIGQVYSDHMLICRPANV